MNRNVMAVVLVLVIFFIISFITNVIGPIFPALIRDFDISLAVAGLLPFSFFAAYGIMSIPAGMLVERYTEKPVIIGAFLLSAIGSLMFAIIPTFSMAMMSLFCIGTGMALLQVAINPLLRVVGKKENFAFFSVLAQLLFGGAATLSPLIYTALSENLSRQTSNPIITLLSTLIPEGMAWLSMYWLFFVLSILMVALVALFKFPSVTLNDDETNGTWHIYGQLIRNKTVILFFIGIGAYVGTEQGVANFISIFLQQTHGLDPDIEGTQVVSNFWLMLTIGCILGLVLIKLMDSRTVLKLFSLSAIISLTIALFGSVHVAVIFFPLVGFFLSVMWSVIFSLALNSIANHHGSFAGILCTGIVGGGLATPLVGLVSDLSGDLRLGMIIVYLTLLYILSIGFWAKPLVKNNTVTWFKKTQNVPKV